MQIDRLFYPVKTLGYGNRIGIWTIGCKHHCYNCSNPELWMEQPEKDISVAAIIKILESYLTVCDGITITGGDPFYQPDELYCLLKKINGTDFSGDILVYTGYHYAGLLEKPLTERILSMVDVLIDGTYIDELNSGKGLAGSSNQNIIILNEKFHCRYDEANLSERKSQIIEANGELLSIGVPFRKNTI